MEEFRELNSINNFKPEHNFDNNYVIIRVLRNSQHFISRNDYDWNDTNYLKDTLDMLEYGPIVRPHFEIFTNRLNRENA